MHDWNVVISIYEGHFRRAKEILEPFGRLAETDYYNLVVLRVADIRRFVDDLQERAGADPSLGKVLSRVLPVSVCFDFQTPAEFEALATQAVEPWIPQLSGKRFHVRMHRRGFRGRLSSQNEERFLDRFLQEKLEELGAQGRIDFEDPDYVLAIETVGQRAGLSLWSREQRQELPLLKLD